MASQARPEPRRKSSKVKQACDCCHTRKIRCDGEDPCSNCLATELRCTYLTIPKKKGPKGPRIGNPPGTYRRRREQVMNGNTAPTIPPPLIPQNTEQRQLNVHGALDGALSFEPSPLISPGIIRRCVEGFFAHKYPIMPILDCEQVYASLGNFQGRPEQYGLITALCAVIILQPEILGPCGPEEDPIEADQLPSFEFFVAETSRSRQFYKHYENPTLATVQTSFFLFATMFPIGRDNSAWFYIREAMTMLQLQRLHEESTYASMADPQYATYCRRTFWLLFITERAYALQRHRPLTLQRTIDLPTVSPGPEATILSGFLDLVSLFQHFDDTFLTLWNQPADNSTTAPQSLVRLQSILELALPDVSNRTEIQQADLLVSRQWLKTMVWQLCVTKGLLSSSTTNESMSFQFPVTIARDVVVIARLLPPEAFEANGVGILEKVFDIGCSLADVLLLHPSLVQNFTMEIDPRDYLIEIMRVLGTVLGGTSKYLRLLAAKADESLQVRIRKGPSESKCLNELAVIEEIIDDEDSEGYECSDAVFFGPSARTVVETQDFGTALQSSGQFSGREFCEEPLDLNVFSPANPANDPHGPPFSLSTPDWNRILEPDSALVAGFS